MELRLRRHSGFHPRWQCAACGEWFVIDNVIASVYDSSGVAVGEVCERCAAASADELRARMRNYAGALLAQAERLEWIAREDVRVTGRVVAETPARLLGEREVGMLV